MKRIGFCVLNKKYQSQIERVVKSVNFPYRVYADYELENAFMIPEIDFSFKTHSYYDSFMNLILSKIKIFSDLSIIYDQVFNFDLDIECKKDITPVLDAYKEPYLYGCLEDTNYLRLSQKRKKVLKFIDTDEMHYINAGFMIMNFQYRFDIDEVRWFFENCPFSNCPEQDFFNWKFKDKIKVMPNDVCWNRFLKPCENPYMIHHLGFPKGF